MSKADKYLFTTVICMVSVASIAVCTFLFIAAPFALGDIDYNEVQRQVAERKATIVQLFCFIGISIFTLIILASGRISQIILRYLDGDQLS